MSTDATKKYFTRDEKKRLRRLRKSVTYWFVYDFFKQYHFTTYIFYKNNSETIKRIFLGRHFFYMHWDRKRKTAKGGRRETDGRRDHPRAKNDVGGEGGEDARKI